MVQRGRKSKAQLATVHQFPRLTGGPPPTDPPGPPTDLGEPEKAIWDAIVGEYNLNSVGLLLLHSGLSAHAGARQCREKLATEGMLITGRGGRLRMHPLCSAERNYWKLFFQTFKALKIRGYE